VLSNNEIGEDSTALTGVGETKGVDAASAGVAEEDVMGVGDVGFT
jgi:hypothetical protein